MIEEWCAKIIAGTGGLRSFQRYEAGGTKPTQIQVARWVVRCLANPQCEGSQEVLDAIAAQRKAARRGGI